MENIVNPSLNWFAEILVSEPGTCRYHVKQEELLLQFGWQRGNYNSRPYT